MDDHGKVQQAQRLGLSNRRLKLTIYGSDRCNMRCFYCYQKHKGSHITDDTTAGIIALIRRRAPGLSSLDLGFFGGEPLLAADNILAIMRSARSESRTHNVKLSAGMTTNAVLLEPRLGELLEAGVTGYQITLDGPASVHDQTRIGPDRKSTFNIIWSALSALKRHSTDHTTLVRVHYRADTIGQLPELIAQISNTLLDDPRFRMLLYPVSTWGSQQDKKIKHLTASEKAWIELSALSVLPPDQRARASGRNLKAIDDVTPCYAAEANAFTISPTGRLGKCTVITDERNTIGQITPDGRLLIDHVRHAPWLQGLVEGDLQRMRCPAHHIPLPGTLSPSQSPPS